MRTIIIVVVCLFTLYNCEQAGDPRLQTCTTITDHELEC